MCEGHSPAARWDELDATLSNLFGQWEDVLRCILSDEEMSRVDMLNEFCDDVRRAIVRLAPELGIEIKAERSQSGSADARTSPDAADKKC